MVPLTLDSQNDKITMMENVFEVTGGKGDHEGLWGVMGQFSILMVVVVSLLYTWNKISYNLWQVSPRPLSGAVPLQKDSQGEDDRGSVFPTLPDSSLCLVLICILSL